MKKKLEAELISIAHRILKLKNKSDIDILHQETQKLYEKLSVLKFVETHLGDVKPTIGQSQIEEKITAAFEQLAQNDKAEELKAEAAEIAKSETLKEEIPAVDEAAPTEAPQEDSVAEVTAPQAPQLEEASVATFDAPAETPETATVSEPETTEPQKTESSFKPAFELAFDAKDDDAVDSEAEQKEEVREDAKEQFKDANAQITFEDILGSSYVDPVFVTPEDLAKENETKKTDNVIPIGRNFSDAPVISINKTDERGYSLNDRISKGITIGLNDRVAFMKHLFNNSSEDYNRVLSQLMTFDAFDEAKSFIDNMVKPDYNNWDGKEEYADRFMEIVEKKFS